MRRLAGATRRWGPGRTRIGGVWSPGAADIGRVGGDLTDLAVWRAAATLAASATQAASSFRGPGSSALADQLVRSAASIPANIAEGYGRSLGRDGARFLRIARGSAAEFESHVRVAQCAGRLAGNDARALIAAVREVRAMLRGLLRHVDARGHNG